MHLGQMSLYENPHHGCPAGAWQALEPTKENRFRPKIAQTSGMSAKLSTAQHSALWETHRVSISVQQVPVGNLQEAAKLARF